MSSLQFLQVSLDALAVVSDNGKHITRQLNFGDGQQKLLGVVISNNTPIALPTHAQFAVRFEILSGRGYISINGGQANHYRDGQNFLATAGANVILTSEEVVQYVRHLEG